MDPSTALLYARHVGRDSTQQIILQDPAYVQRKLCEWSSLECRWHRLHVAEGIEGKNLARGGVDI